MYHSLISLSQFARYTFQYKEENVYMLARCFQNHAFNFEGDKAELIEKIRQALYFSQKSFYALGFAQLRVASKDNTWKTCLLQISHLSGVLAVSSVLVSCKRLQMLTTAMQLLPTFFWTSSSWITAKYQQAQCDIVALAVLKLVCQCHFSQQLSYTLIDRSVDLPALT